MKRILLPSLLILTACGTPQERCIGAATRDMRVVDRLIAEVETNIRRGYTLEEVTVYTTQWVDCTPRVKPGTPAPKPQMCLDDVPQTVTKPKAIDLDAESAKLKSLKTKRAAQAKASAPEIKTCKAQFPE
jgi:hypothetical protein